MVWLYPLSWTFAEKKVVEIQKFKNLCENVKFCAVNGRVNINFSVSVKPHKLNIHLFRNVEANSSPPPATVPQTNNRTGDTRLYVGKIPMAIEQVGAIIYMYVR